MDIGKSIHYSTGGKLHESMYREIRLTATALINPLVWALVNQSTNANIWESIINSDRLWI